MQQVKPKVSVRNGIEISDPLFPLEEEAPAWPEDDDKEGNKSVWPIYFTQKKCLVGNR